jgi:acetylglutamate kinase
LNPQDARELIEYGVASGGMITKVEACLLALTKVPVTRIIDGRVAHALLDEVEGKGDGTTMSW